MHEALAHGIPRGEIRQAMLQAGWDRERSDAALAAFADIAFPVPVPHPVPAVTVRETFHYLVLFLALATFTYSLGTLMFAIIDKLLPDAANQYLGIIADYTIRWSMARLLIGFPVFLLMSSSWQPSQ